MRARDGDALALSAGEFHAAIADDGVVTLRQIFDEFVRQGGLGRLDQARRSTSPVHRRCCSRRCR